MEMKFKTGRTVITRNATTELCRDDVSRALSRHAQGDWGDVCKEDWELNDLAIKTEQRLLSVYHDRDGTMFYVITESDRSATTVLLPDEY